MGTKSKNIPKEALHTPDELLQGAEFLVDSDNPTMWRAAILEAFSALETYVQAATFLTLDRNTYSSSSLGEWLKGRLDDHLDTRLSLLESVAIRDPIDAQLWKDFGDAKKIRNLITHQGKKVSAPDARFVIQTVYKLLQYLGSTLELELALASLKRYVEENGILLRTEDDAVAFVSGYFGRNKAAYSYTDLPKVEFPKNQTQLKCELVLVFGKYRILVEIRLVKASETPHLLGRQTKSRFSDGETTTWQSVFDDLVGEVHEALGLLDLTQGAIVVFVDHDSEVPPDDGFTWVKRSRGYEWGFWNCQRRVLAELESVRKYHDDRIHAIAVNIRHKPSVETDAVN